jgi:hypothetical protein
LSIKYIKIKPNRKIVMQALFGVTEVFFGAGGRNKGLLYITIGILGTRNPHDYMVEDHQISKE